MKGIYYGKWYTSPLALKLVRDFRFVFKTAHEKEENIFLFFRSNELASAHARCTYIQRSTLIVESEQI